MISIPKNAAFLFPGAGVSLCGHEFEFYCRHREIMYPFFERTGQVSGLNPAIILERNNSSSLDDLANQLFTYAYSFGMYEVFRSKGFTPSLLAPYSLGIYPALAASGAVAFEDGIRLIDEAHALMEHAVTGSVLYGMGVVIGFSREECFSLIQELDLPALRVVNSNNVTCHVVSGTKRDLEQLLKTMKEKGALKSELLPVRIPYHHPVYLAETSAAFEKYCNMVKWEDPHFPVLSPVNCELLRSGKDLRDLTADNLKTPIHWHRTIETIVNTSIGSAVECGPGISLTQNARFVPGELHIVNVKNCMARAGF